MRLSDRKVCVVFNKISVTNIEDSSGIFIGTNEAIGWSAYKKSNQGFGSLSDSVLSGSVSVVRDSDAIDMPVRDARFIALTEAGGSARQSAVEFRSVNVNSAANASAIDIGDIKQLGWRTAKKNNYGEGKNFGRNQISRSIHVVFDDDAVDNPIVVQQNVLDRSGPSASNVQIVQKNPPTGADPAP